MCAGRARRLIHPRFVRLHDLVSLHGKVLVDLGEGCKGGVEGVAGGTFSGAFLRSLTVLLWYHGEGVVRIEGAGECGEPSRSRSHPCLGFVPNPVPGAFKDLT